MASQVDLISADQLLQLPRGEKRYELITGELRVTSPAGSKHGRTAMRIGSMLDQYVRERGSGAVFAAETGFVLARDPDTVRAPDAAFVCQARLDEVGDVEGYWPGPPDLAAEVVSPNDSFSEVEEKALHWLSSGARLVWVVDPFQQNVTVYRSANDIRVLDVSDTLEADDLLPGWSIQIGELFR